MFASCTGVRSKRAAEGQRQGVKIVQDQPWIIRKNVFLWGEDDLVFLVEGVADREHCTSQIGINWQQPCANPTSQRTVHRGTFVGVAFAGVIEDDSGDVILTSELDLCHKEMLVAAVVYNAAADTTAIDEDSIRTPKGPRVEDVVGEFDGGDAIEDFAEYGSCITSLTREDDGVVGAITGNIDTNLLVIGTSRLSIWLVCQN